MPDNGTGTFTLTYNWNTDQANGIFVRADRMETQEADIASGLTNRITRDGQSPPTANLPLGGYKWTGGSVLAYTTLAGTDLPTYAQMQAFLSANYIPIGSPVGPSSFNDNSFRVYNNADNTKLIAFSASNITTGTTRTFQVPDANDTMAVLSAAQTLLNKTITYPTLSVKTNVFTVVDNADPTKILAFDCSAMTTGVTRTWQIPDANGTFVGLTNTQTLTNKTLTNPTVTNYLETVFSLGTGSAFSPVYTNGTIQTLTTNANTTITLPAPVAGKSMTIQVTYGGTHTITWAGGGVLKYAGGTAPAATSSNGKIDLYIINSYDGTNTFVRDGGRSF